MDRLFYRTGSRRWFSLGVEGFPWRRSVLYHFGSSHSGLRHRLGKSVVLMNDCGMEEMAGCGIDRGRGESEAPIIDWGMEADQFIEALTFGGMKVVGQWFRALVHSCGDNCLSAADRLQTLAAHLIAQGHTEFGASAAGLSYIIRTGLQYGKAHGIMVPFVKAKGNMLSYYEEGVAELGRFLSSNPAAVAALA